MKERLLVPLAGTVESESILAHLPGRARRGSTVVLLRVELPVVVDQHLVLTDPPLDHARRYLESVRSRLELPARIETVARVGPPGETILQVAGEVGATQILLTSGRRGALARWLFGSVVQQVVRQSPIPVLVIPAREPLQTAV